MITSKLKSFVANYFLGNTILQKYLLTLVNNAKEQKQIWNYNLLPASKSAGILVQGYYGVGCLISGSLGCQLRKVKYKGQLFNISSISLLISGYNRA